MWYTGDLGAGDVLCVILRRTGNVRDGEQAVVLTARDEVLTFYDEAFAGSSSRCSHPKRPRAVAWGDNNSFPCHSSRQVFLSGRKVCAVMALKA